jgi:hypothetical protein
MMTNFYRIEYNSRPSGILATIYKNEIVLGAITIKEKDKEEWEMVIKFLNNREAMRSGIL